MGQVVVQGKPQTLVTEEVDATACMRVVTGDGERVSSCLKPESEWIGNGRWNYYEAQV